MKDNEELELFNSIPVGTQVVTRVNYRDGESGSVHSQGTVGVVEAQPDQPGEPYLVRLSDGTSARLHHSEISIRKHFQQPDYWNAPGPAPEALYQYVIYRCIVGSRAFGLDEAESDIDRRGIYLPPAELQWSLFGVPGQLENPALEECYWELEKFLQLAVKANPNVLECLYTPLVEYASPLAEELLAMKSAFLSKLIYQTYNGYVISQFKKLQQDLRTRGEIRWKHAMHLVRLLLSGITTLREGFVPLRIEEHREALLAIRRGELSWDEVNRWRLALNKEFGTVYSSTALPERPDYKKVNDFLIKARLSMVAGRELCK